jgi:hypothetical protein
VKAAWRAQIVDLAQLNSEETEEVLDDYEDLFLEDEELRQWDEEEEN